jgi:hypothetical protein
LLQLLDAATTRSLRFRKWLQALVKEMIEELVEFSAIISCRTGITIAIACRCDLGVAATFAVVLFQNNDIS